MPPISEFTSISYAGTNNLSFPIAFAPLYHMKCADFSLILSFPALIFANSAASCVTGWVCLKINDELISLAPDLGTQARIKV